RYCLHYPRGRLAPRPPTAEPALTRREFMARFGLLALASLVLASSGALRAETKLELKNVHLCCPACVRTVGEILGKVDGVKGKCDTKTKTVSLTATDAATAQKAVDALAAGGFHGDTGDKEIT